MKNNVKRLLAFAVAVLMVLSVSASALAMEVAGGRPEAQNARVLESKATASYDLSGIRNGRTFAISGTAEDEIAADQVVTIMVELADAPAMEVYGQYKAAESYAAALREKQDVAVKSIRRDLGVDVDVIYNYTLLFNGFSFRGEYRLVEELNRMEGVNAFVAAEWDCPEIKLFNSGDMVGAIDAWDLDYTGAGTAIAIIDTGMMVDHPAFSTMPDESTLRFTQDDIAAAIQGGHLQGAGNANLTLSNVYYNAKIPFRWNYVHNTYDVAHRYNDHGTHVGGISAGNNDEIQGIAKDAQLVPMQVFGDSGGAGWAEILAALEDCVVLGVDAANLSLGSPCGFTNYYAPSYASTFQNLVNAGVNLSMSAGNEYSTALGNAWASSSTSVGYALVANPDYGVVGSPSTWPESLSIAAVNNSKASAFTIENVATGSLYSYTENAENLAKLVATFGGQTLDFVAVPGYGDVADYEGIDVNGKVAVVKRGEINFVDKGLNAQNNGAIACIIYNNVEGSINMVSDPGITIPFVFVLKDSGDEMAAQGQGQILINTEQSIVDVPDGYQPSDFSSWGPTSDLKFKPEITAPGGNIYSSTDPRPNMSGAYYQVWSGTSMSAPHVSGGMAIVTSYVNDVFPNLSAAEKQNMVDTILMSTANPVVDAGGELASPRKQGAGLMDLADAVTTTSYITVPGCSRPKLELGDDPARTGVYEMNFVVNNFGDADLAYTVVPHILTDDLAGLAYDNDNNLVIGFTQTSMDITADCDIDMPDVVIVPAGGSTEVNLTVTLHDDLVEYFDYYYTNGTFIEGFITLEGAGGSVGDVNDDGEVNTADALAVMRYAMNVGDLENPAAADVNGDGQIDMADALLIMRCAMGLENAFVTGDSEAGAELNVPFLAFYGDWNYVPMFDQGFYYDDFSYGSNPADNIIGSAFGNQVYGLGINPYVDTEDLSYYMEDRNAVSPNDDGFLDTADYIRLGLMRNAEEAGYELIDSNGTVTTLAHQEQVRKNYYSTSSETYTNLGTDMGLPKWNASNYIGTDVTIRAYAYLSNDGSTTTEPFTADTDNMFNEWNIPIYVDGAAPTAEVVSYANGVLTLNVSDEHYAAYAGAWDGSIVNGEVVMNGVIAETGIFETERGMTTQVTLEGVTEGALICLGDYAGNEIVYVFDGEALEPAAESWSHAAVSAPDVTMYAYGKNLQTQAWVKFSTGDIAATPTYGGGINNDASDYRCGDYDGQYVWAVSNANELIRYDATDINAWTNKTTVGTITGSSYGFNEMAYDKTTGKMYLVAGAGIIYELNTETAAITQVCESNYGVMAMAFGDDGTCYIIDQFGYLCTMDMATGNQTSEIGNYGVSPVNSQGQFMLQCATYMDGFFYWVAADANITQYSQIHMLAIKANTGEYTDLGAVFGGLYTLCLFAYKAPVPEQSIDPVDFYDNFEGSFDWDVIDQDGDGKTWEVKYWTDGLYFDGSKAAVSYSWLDEILYPDNWMVSPEIEIGEGQKYLSYFTASANQGAGADIDEHWQVIVIPEGVDVADGIVVEETTMTTANVTEHLVDMSDFAGETVRIAFRHFNCSDEYTLIIDGVGIGDML